MYSILCICFVLHAGNGVLASVGCMELTCFIHEFIIDSLDHSCASLFSRRKSQLLQSFTTPSLESYQTPLSAHPPRMLYCEYNTNSYSTMVLWRYVVVLNAFNNNLAGIMKRRTLDVVELTRGAYCCPFADNSFIVQSIHY